ncbi:MAG: hypothetical protein LBT05_15180 [Planctomycetaceae bacterium]|jgi:hypothetical protein|nr:hypothetical protein [Planctomycetaceae bacterium]
MRIFNCGDKKRIGVVFFAGALFVILNVILLPQTFAQQAGHSFYPNRLPIGVVGQGALLQPFSMQGYLQQVKFLLPEGTKIAFATNDKFLLPEAAPFQIGLFVGNVYRFQLTDIPYHAGKELYPSVEVIDRLYPPAGKEMEFPVEIEITQEDLEIAMNGRMVTRIIYLEDAFKAQPTTGEERIALSEELKPEENALEAAKKFGRPMAILRIGNRQPDPNQSDSAFFFGSPTWIGKQNIEIQAQSGQKIVR